ncbi:hypothetical protein BGW37DRAFT_422423 [Umbelopsis sp. PMI_123]|nr:hypothetical protein BGW37DRAFT_422423 [Umbelopsis sp. PMI_123]
MYRLQRHTLPLLLLLWWTAITSAYRSLPNAALDKITGLSVNERLLVNGSYLKPLLVPRVAGTEDNIKVRNFLKEHFEKLKWQVEEDKFVADTPLGQKEFSNIIVTKNPQYTSRLVLAAHYDSKYYQNFEFIGATDSSVPCAILMDVADTLDPYLDSAGVKSALQFIFFDGEEAFVEWSDTDSIYGAKHLADKWEKQVVPTGKYHTSKQSSMLDTIEVMVLLDLLGASNAKVYNLFRSTSWLFDHMSNLENRLVTTGNWRHDGDEFDQPDMIFDTQGVNMFHGQIQDDHIPFLVRGVNVFHIIPTPFPRVWHSIHDNADAIDVAVVQNLAVLFRCFTAEYLELEVLGHQEL